MKQIQLLSLDLLNFKGGTMKINFNKTTNIEGANGSGKTRVFDAFTWLLFGKNSLGLSVFNIKTLGTDSTPIHKLSHEVTGELIVDGSQVTLKRVYQEDWVRPRGGDAEALKGHTTTYFINDVPVSMQEYQTRIDSICSEEEFKLLTNPLAFTSLHWEKQRQMLFAMAGEINPALVCVGKNDFLDLIERMKGTDEKNYQQQLRTKINKCKEELEKIKPAIDEVIRMTPTAQAWESIEKLIESKQKDLETISGQLSSFNNQVDERNKKVLELSDLILEKKQRMSELVATDKDKALRQYHSDLEVYRKNNSLLQEVMREITSLQSQKSNIEGEIGALTKRIDTLKEEYANINLKTLTYASDEFNCKVCGARFDDNKIFEMQEHTRAEFNRNKAEGIAKNTEEGTRLVASRRELNQKIAVLEEQILSKTSIKDNLVELCKGGEPAQPAYEYKPDTEYLQLETDIEALKKEQSEGIDLTEQSILKNQLSETLREIQDLNKTLNDRDTITRNNKRIDELRRNEKAINQELADYEREEKVLFDYSKYMTEYVEQRVCSMFEIVKFKLFNQQINGGETPTCQAMVNGVPFADQNNAMKIAAGIDIIKALQKHMNTFAPIFIDNRESVSEIPSTECQIINLIVNANQKTLKIS